MRSYGLLVVVIAALACGGGSGDGEGSGSSGMTSVPADGSGSSGTTAGSGSADTTATDAQLELWIDGALVDTETSALRTDMRQFWDSWPGFGGAQDGWFWGAEKQAAVGKLSVYEDYKGLMAEVRFWDVALQDIEATYADAVGGDEPGLVGYYPWSEGAGAVACDVLSAECVDLYRTDDGQWVEEGPPLR